MVRHFKKNGRMRLDSCRDICNATQVLHFSGNDSKVQIKACHSLCQEPCSDGL